MITKYGASWQNVPGAISIEIIHEEEWSDITYSNDLPESLLEELNKLTVDYVEMVIDFKSSGFYDSGSMYGGADHLGWPPDGEDERELDGTIKLYSYDGDLVCTLSAKVADDVFYAYLKQIENVEIDKNYDDRY